MENNYPLSVISVMLSFYGHKFLHQ